MIWRAEQDVNWSARQRNQKKRLTSKLALREQLLWRSITPREVLHNSARQNRWLVGTVLAEYGACVGQPGTSSIGKLK
jgi:hypothetical protein